MRTVSLHVLRFFLLLALSQALWAQEPGADRLALQSPRLAALLAAVERDGDKGVDVSYREFVGSHHYAYWQQTLPEALVAMLGRAGRIDPTSY